MKKIEAVYREILYRAIEAKEFNLTQSELSKKLNISLSMVNRAVKKLHAMGAVKIGQRSFHILDTKKIMYVWASVRNLEKDVVFEARVELSVREIEGMLPDVWFTAYTAYKFIYNDVPADYAEVYVYADEKELKEIKKRIGTVKHSEKNLNLFVLKKDANMNLYKRIPLAQLFVDLWNLKEWYAKDFIKALENKMEK